MQSISSSPSLLYSQLRTNSISFFHAGISSLVISSIIALGVYNFLASILFDHELSRVNLS
jgi:hypothetical protein